MVVGAQGLSPLVTGASARSAPVPVVGRRQSSVTSAAAGMSCAICKRATGVATR
ncbi:hypothetical protein MAJHIDBO_01463 [Propionibacterium freudenreichii subsp. shermanii]|nr:Hypothetical protein PFR_J18_1363 [Propionibacterium freudenreichii]SPB31141.1 hypothetical protein MAJHIDBO_01463 [Propionibacterium freudenreichii subsp. shermanii]SCQ64840.1 Hypothetical protein PFR_JS15-1_962 [Propionibacterium freudenreichii]SCQ73321.1 Hypothetical protein PFR_JS20-1_1104 [Propionibacterium freudenreichii]SCQ73945.1 Hypothetical protein PFR_JS15-2_963 [Propionibacterium freudenreichii]